MEKSELLELLEESRAELLALLETVPDAALTEPGVLPAENPPGDWSIKDILAHLTFWEGQIVALLFQARQGDAPKTAHFSQETVDQINQRMRAVNQDRLLERVWEDWLAVRKQTLRRVDEWSDAELNDAHLFPWLKNTALFEWVLSDTVEHEDEHAANISDWLDRREARNN